MQPGAAGFLVSSGLAVSVPRAEHEGEMQPGEWSGKVPAQKPEEALWSPFSWGSVVPLQGGLWEQVGLDVPVLRFACAHGPCLPQCPPPPQSLCSWMWEGFLAPFLPESSGSPKAL